MSLVCPSPDQFTVQALALLPRGRAWRTHETGPQPDSILWRFWRAVGEVFTFVNGRICALHPEFFCASATETLDLWMAEYGLPDDCDPFPNLCAKVAVRGGPDCEVYRAIAADAGWDIDCDEQRDECGARADCFRADGQGAFAAASTTPGRITIRVYRETSTAYRGRLRGSAQADCLMADGLLACLPDISGLVCILNRVIHAHVLVDYVIGEPRTTLTDAPLTADSGLPVTGAA